MTTTPPKNGPGARADEDPTGVRALLGSLPDPGPMPDNISRSISDALSREQQARAGDTPGTRARSLPWCEEIAARPASAGGSAPRSVSVPPPQ